MSSYWRLFRYLRPHLGVLGLAGVCMAGSTLFEGVSAGALAPFVDRILTRQAIIAPVQVPQWLASVLVWFNGLDPWVLLQTLAICLPLLFLGKGLTKFLQQYFMNDASERVIRDLRQALFDKCTALSIGFFDRQSTGALVSRVTYDVGIVQNSITECATDLIYQSFRALMFATIVFTVNWRWALVIFVVLPLIAIPVQRLGRALKKLSTRSQETVGDLNNTLYETYTGMPIVQAYGMEEASRQRFRGQNRGFYRLQLKMIKRREILAPLTEVTCALAAAPLLWYGGREVLIQHISPGLFVLFVGSFFAMIHPFKRISRVNGVIQQAVAAADRLFEILDEPVVIEEAPQAQPLAPLRDAIRYEDVSFAYNPSTPVLQHLNLEITAGEAVAFVGASGVGKTTLVSLLPRFYDPTHGRITIDGQDLRQVTVASLRQHMALVTQETVLFNDTVSHNIAWGRLDASQDHIETAARNAHAHEFIQALPRGYDTRIGEGGGLLSGGQRQRLALARAFLRDAPILILDEATSQLDAESEQLISEAVNRLMQGRTVLLIAHRLSTIRHARRIIVMHEGQIVDEGTHEELLLKNPLYRRVASLQFSNGFSDAPIAQPREAAPRIV